MRRFVTLIGFVAWAALTGCSRAEAGAFYADGFYAPPGGGTVTITDGDSIEQGSVVEYTDGADGGAELAAASGSGSEVLVSTSADAGELTLTVADGGTIDGKSDARLLPGSSRKYRDSGSGTYESVEASAWEILDPTGWTLVDANGVEDSISIDGDGWITWTVTHSTDIAPDDLHRWAPADTTWADAYADIYDEAGTLPAYLYVIEVDASLSAGMTVAAGFGSDGLSTRADHRVGIGGGRYNTGPWGLVSNADSHAVTDPVTYTGTDRGAVYSGALFPNGLSDDACRTAVTWWSVYTAASVNNRQTYNIGNANSAWANMRPFISLAYDNGAPTSESVTFRVRRRLTTSVPPTIGL